MPTTTTQIPSLLPPSQSRPITDIPVEKPRPVDLFLGEFSQNIGALLATLQHVSPHTLPVDCVTNIHMSLQGFRDVFQFSIEDIATLNGNDNTTDLHFYVEDDALSEIEHAVDGGDIALPGENVIPLLTGTPVTSLDYHTGATLPPVQLNMASDFTRYLAKSIFGTVAALDLFSNEKRIVSDVTQQINRAWTEGDIAHILVPISVHGTDPHLLVDPLFPSYGKYLDDRDPSGAYWNIGQTLFHQLLTLAPARFTTKPPNGLLLDMPHHEPQPLPFIAGDSVSWRLNMYPAAGQASYVTGKPVPFRVYRVRMILTDAAGTGLKSGPEGSWLFL